MPKESGTWNGRGQIKPVGLPTRSGRQCGRLHCHPRVRGIVEGSSFQLGGGIMDLNPFCLLQAKKKSFSIFFFFFF